MKTMKTVKTTKTVKIVKSLVITALVTVALALGALPALAAEEVVNVNQAGIAELTLLPRIGPALAARILEYRDANGELESPEDLMLVRGIGERTFELMAPFVTVSGETTLTSKVDTSRAEAAAARSGEGGKDEKDEKDEK